jgi:primosomal protein N' (replication factor Y)
MMSDPKQYIEVALPLPVRKTFTYEVPAGLKAEVSPGKRVLVPFGRRILTGLVLGPAQTLPSHTAILPLRQVLDGEISLPEKSLRLLLWVSRYYLEPIGEVMKAAFPAGVQVRSKETLVLTAAGEEALPRLPADWPEGKILHDLKDRKAKEASFSSLQKKYPTSLRTALERMKGKGWVERKEDLDRAQVREKKINWARLRSSQEEVRLSPGQKEILDFLRKAGPVPVSELKARYKNASPSLNRLKVRGLVEIFPQESFREPSWEGIEDWFDGPPSLLTEDQERALAEISAALHERKFRPFLLHGVTGSGKTEVYLRAIEETVSRGRQALLLVPEISLTGQLLAYFRSRIQYPMAVLHSGLSAGERYDEWRRVRKGLVQLVIGARSAVFAPLDSPGIIIIDEEHDPSYKQEEKVRYHARDLALVRGKMENAVVILGSATPSLESYHNALGGKFKLLSLPARIDRRPLPEIRILDMRQEQGEGKEKPVFSRALRESLEQSLARGEQALLFLNRRGFSTFALCRDCGFVHRCPNCSVSLTYHLPDKTFRCHYCDHVLSAPDRCPECASPAVLLFGIGTQRLEEEIKKILPQVPVSRMDRDSTTRKGSHQRILGQVRRGEVNLLIGTQMITKGHDFPRVTLVGVLAADLSLNVPDFRAGERTFQLLTQVAGRAGRGDLPGKVLIQSFAPEHYSIQLAQSQDYAAFYRQEIQFRREMAYPPFVRLVNLRLESNSESRLRKYAQALEAQVQGILKGEKKYREEVDILGPAMAPLARLKGKHRCQMLFKGKRWNSLHEFTERVLARIEERIPARGVKLTVDVDPVHML